MQGAWTNVWVIQCLESGVKAVYLYQELCLTDVGGHQNRMGALDVPYVGRRRFTFNVSKELEWMKEGGKTLHYKQ
jgi:hypothetical protein